MNQDLLRKIPKIDVLLARPALENLKESVSRNLIKKTAQEYLQKLRGEILAETITEIPAIEEIEQAVLNKLLNTEPYHLKRVVNATGVVLHTNLGRAPLGGEVAERLAEIAQGYCNLEYDIEAGKRGSRYSHVEDLICKLTGAEAAMVVNNNAGAVFLMLNTLAKGKKVAISRGELVEIGGSFRVPEIMEQSGAELVEVGTTNKTHPEDYSRAVTEKNATVLLKVHTSNFAVVGFTESVSVSQMADIAKENDALVLYDVGSGFLFPSEWIGLHDGENVSKALQDGADVVCFSGDKLMGSAQGGILAGKKELIDRIRKNHLTRMLRIDKLSLAALEVALRHCLDPQEACEKIPTLHMLSMSRETCREKASLLRNKLSQAAPSFCMEVIETEDEAGGGSLPGVVLNSCAVAVSSARMSARSIENYMRSYRTAIITRVWKERVIISPRTLCQGDEQELIQAFTELENLVNEERTEK